MEKLFTFFIIFTISAGSFFEKIDCDFKNQISLSRTQYRQQNYGLNGYGQDRVLGKAYIISIKLLREMHNQRLAIEMEKKLKIDEEKRTRQKLQKAIERAKLERNNFEAMKKEAERRKIYKMHLLPYHMGSNILMDFHTNRI